MTTMTAYIPKAWSSTQSSNVTDGFLWVSFRRGDREALEKLYALHAAGMYRYGLKLCGDPDIVKDGIQDLFSRLWSTREFISNAGCVQMYLYRSLRRAIIGEMIKRRKQVAGAKKSHQENPECSIEDQLIIKEINRDQFKLLRCKLDLLTRHQREAIVLRFFNGLAYKQIAEIMGLQIDSVYNLTSKGLDILRSNRILS